VRQCATASAPRQRLRQRSSTEAIIGGVTGTIGRPETLLLGRYDADGVLRYIGHTRPLTPSQRAEFAGVLRPPRSSRQRATTHPWPRPLPASWLGHLGISPYDVPLTVTD
jgi:hypothetical protein